ncbi:MAG: phage baseplate upper protein [Faecalibacterium sp.]|nr:phage baseplate upper protein [Ruminococcus sp.]MCM1486479.1 phage baseplate upper protein [Faecalibacterium sp.]
MKIIKKIELDFARDTTQVNVYAKQYDTGSRFVEIIPLNKGERWTVQEGTLAKLRLTKPDGNIVMNDAQLTEDGTVLVELTMQALNVSGKVRAEIAFYKDDSVISSQIFFINVEKAAFDENVPKSTPEYESLTKTLSRAQLAVSDAEQAAENANRAAKNADSASRIVQNAGKLVSPTVDVISEDGGHRVIFTDKYGDKEFIVKNGENAPAAKLTIGTVETLESGSNATATLTGTDEEPVLNLGIPRGQTGENEPEIPLYIQNEVNSVADQLIKHQTHNNITFLAMADFHEFTGNANIENGNLHAGMAAKLLKNSVRLDFAALLGDLCIGLNTKESMKINRHIGDAFCGIPNFRTPGEADYLIRNYYSRNMHYNVHQIYALFGKYNEGAVFDEPNRVRGYCYRDFDVHKIRVICLNSVDLAEYTLTSNKEFARISPEQLQWFAKSLDLSAKTDASEWGIVILAHHPLDWSDIMPAAAILNSYLKGESVNLTHEDKQVTYNFSGKNQAEVICQVHGHIHNYKIDNIRADSSGTLTTVKRICVPNACFQKNNELLSNPIYGESRTSNKMEGTASDTAFYIISIDRDEKKIYCTHYGAGADKEVSYA